MDVSSWLKEIGLGDYAFAFEAQAIDATLLPTLTDGDLRELGVTALGHRKKLLAAIAALSPRAEPATSHVAERRQLTVAFVDLVGSTALSAALDPEDLRALIRDYQNLAAGEIARFGGHVAQYLGDGVLAYFGWPRAYEDNAERAVRASLGIIDGLARRPAGAQPLRVRIGIATGKVIVGDLIGEGTRSRETAIGETPNVAARLQGIATPGNILITDATRRLLGTTFELQALEQQTFKGMSEPLAVFQVLGERRVGSRYAARAGNAFALYGRNEELDLLRSRWARAAQGDAQIVVVSGEAGIGKSRLSEAAIELVEPADHYLLRYQCSPFHTDTALYPILEQLRHAAKLTAEDPPIARIAKLRQLLAPGSREVEITLHFVAAQFGLEVAYPGGTTLSPQQRRMRTHEVLVEQIVGLCHAKPMLWVFEDAHWIDPSTLELLERAAGQITDCRVMMLITSRPGFTSSILNQPNCTVLSLASLPRSAASELILAQTGGKPLPDAVRDEIFARTDGVPLYIEETTRAVLESGVITERDGELVARGDIQAGFVPASLQDSLLARLDRLGEAKPVAQAAAVIGRTFDFQTLATIVGPAHDFDAALRALEHSGLLFRRGSPPNAAYTFKHALVRDIAYDSLLRAQRVALHGRVLEALEAQQSTAYAVMAQHAEAASRDDAALTWWERATAQSLAIPALKEALSRNENALRVCRKLGSAEVWQRRAQALYVQRAQITIPVFGYTSEQTREAFVQAYEIARDLNDLTLQLPAAYGLVPVYYVAGEAFREATGRFADLAARHPEDGPSLVAARLQGLLAFHDGKFDAARRLFTQAVAGFDPDRHQDLLRRYGQDNCTAAETYLCLAEWIMGYADTADLTAERALSRARSLNHPNTHLYSLCLGRMELSMLLRERDEVGRMAREALRLSEEYGAGNYVGWCRMALMWATGDIAFATEINDTTAWGRWRPLTWALTSEVFLTAGDHPSAVRCIGKAVAWLEAMEDVAFAAEVYRRRAEILLAVDTRNRDAAVADLHHAIDIARRQQARAWALRAAVDLARIWGESGERRRALDLLGPIHGTFDEGFDTQDLKDASALLKALN